MSETITTIALLRPHISRARAEGKSIGFVPTMGALHEGHLSLIRHARADCDLVVVSIFVNPTQFPPGTDFEKYPRDLPADVSSVTAVGADLIFSPSAEDIYPPNDATIVEVTGPLVEALCGPFRPGHFRGVTTVCARLFNIVQPDRAYFGEKDYQQLLIIKKMVRDLHFPLKIIPLPIVREADGLAMSSRNRYLAPHERAAATVLSRALFAARERFAAGERDSQNLLSIAREIIDSEPLVKLEYLELREAETLAEIAYLDRSAVLAIAAYVGLARLIDNIILSP